MKIVSVIAAAVITLLQFSGIRIYFCYVEDETRIENELSVSNAK